MPSFDDTPEGRYESLMYYGQWTDGDTVSALVSKDEDIAALRSLVESLEEVKADQKARIEQDGKRMEAAKALRRAAGEANAELVVSQDVLKAFGLLNLALCAYDAALAALEAPDA